MGCSGSKSGPTYETEESRKDAAANALQLAATAHLRKKASSTELKPEEDAGAKAKREAEAAMLLQRAASAHLALAEPVKPPGLNIPAPPSDGSANTVIANVIESARGVATAIGSLFGSDQQPSAAASGAGVRPPSLAIPATGAADTQSGDNLFTQALNSARGLFGGGPAEPTVSAAEELAAKLEAEEAAAAQVATPATAMAQAGPPSPTPPSPTAATEATATATASAAAAVATGGETATAETSAEPVLEQNPPSPEAVAIEMPKIEVMANVDAFRPSLPTPEPSPKAASPRAPETPSKSEVSQVL